MVNKQEKSLGDAFRNQVCSKRYVIRSLFILVLLEAGLLYTHAPWWNYLVAILIYTLLIFTFDFLLLLYLERERKKR